MYNEPTDPYEDEVRFHQYCADNKICEDCGENQESPDCCCNQR